MADHLQPGDLVYDAMGRPVGVVGDVHQDWFQVRRQDWASGNTFTVAHPAGDGKFIIASSAKAELVGKVGRFVSGEEKPDER